MNRITAIHEAIGASRNESEAISRKVNITVGDRTITATMEDNAAGRDFLSRLPLEVTFESIKLFVKNLAVTTTHCNSPCTSTKRYLRRRPNNW